MANYANRDRIGTPGRACERPLPLRGRLPLQGGHYILPLAKGESRRRRQGVAHTRPHVSYTSFKALARVHQLPAGRRLEFDPVVDARERQPARDGRQFDASVRIGALHVEPLATGLSSELLNAALRLDDKNIFAK